MLVASKGDTRVTCKCGAVLEYSTDDVYRAVRCDVDAMCHDVAYYVRCPECGEAVQLVHATQEARYAADAKARRDSALTRSLLRWEPSTAESDLNVHCDHDWRKWVSGPAESPRHYRKCVKCGGTAEDKWWSQ